MRDDKVAVKVEQKVVAAAVWQGPLPPPEVAAAYEKFSSPHGRRKDCGYAG